MGSAAPARCPTIVGVDETDGARTFAVTGRTYDTFMGRYAVRLAGPFADAAGVVAGQRAVDVGCGPGALTAELVARLGAASVRACDPSPPFRDECARRHPGVDVRLARAEDLPFPDADADAALAQLVLHFVADGSAAIREMARVVRPGGVVGACVWDFAEGMQMLRAFWDAALAVDPDAPDEARVLRYGGPGELAELLTGAGLRAVEESSLRVEASYAGFDELWEGFLGGVGPAGAHLLGLPADERARLRDALDERLGRPAGAFTLGAVARCAVGRTPG